MARFVSGEVVVVAESGTQSMPGLHCEHFQKALGAIRRQAAGRAALGVPHAAMA